MTPELYSDDNGNRVIVRHIGPPGLGLPAGGTAGQVLVKASSVEHDSAWQTPADDPNVVSTPSTQTAGKVAAFTGNLREIGDSGIAVANIATVAQLNSKVDKVIGMGLSEADFTLALNDKLNALTTAGFRGAFETFVALQQNTFSPVPSAGDYCTIESGLDPAQLVIWDDTLGVWTLLSFEPDVLDGAAIALILFDDGSTWTNDQSLVFTPAHKALLDAHETLIQSFTGNATNVVNYAAVSTNYIVQNYIKTVECVSGSFVVTLPTAVNQTTDITIKNAGGGTITVNTADGIQTIDGVISIALTAVNESVTLRSTGLKWLIV